MGEISSWREVKDAIHESTKVASRRSLSDDCLASAVADVVLRGVARTVWRLDRRLFRRWLSSPTLARDGLSLVRCVGGVSAKEGGAGDAGEVRLQTAPCEALEVLRAQWRHTVSRPSRETPLPLRIGCGGTGGNVLPWQGAALIGVTLAG